MKKSEVIKCILFLTIFFIILIPLSYILRTSGDVKDRFVGFYAEKNNSIDVVMIGPSSIHPYFSTPQIWGEHGIAVYPLSSNQQRPEAAINLIKEAQKTQNPKLYVFEMRQYAATTESMEENMSYVRGVTDNLKYSINRIELINKLIDDPGERYTYYFDIIKYHSNWSSLFIPEQLRTFNYEYPNELKGYQYVDKVARMLPWDYSNITEVDVLPDNREENLYDLLEYLKKENIQAVFVVSPYATLDEARMKRYNYLAPIIESYGYDYINFNNMMKELNIDCECDFYDGGAHMNALGAQKVTKYLGDYFANQYNLEDKRGNVQYKSWDEAYKLWLEKYDYFSKHWQENIEKDFTK